MAATTNWIVYQVALKAFVECKKHKCVSLSYLEEIAFKKYKYSIFSYMQWLISDGIFHGSCLGEMKYYLRPLFESMNIAEFQEYYKQHHSIK